MMDNADIEDIFNIPYPLGTDWNPPPPENFDPGRNKM